MDNTDIREMHDIMSERNIIVSYIGPFDNAILTILAENIQNSLWEDQYKGQKFFKIFIELAQNISLYSKEISHTDLPDQAGEGTLIINEYADHFDFAAGNLVDITDVTRLIEKCDAINCADREQLRQMKRELRNQEHERVKGGGNIGLVHVALTSGYPLKYKLIDFKNDNEAFYIISVRIDK
jgi:hypothetical protein